MKEKILKDYLDNKVNVDILATDLKGSHRKTSDVLTSFQIDDINETGEYEITRQHLSKLCDGTIAGHLTTADLKTIAFALISSEYFSWDNKTTDGEIVSGTIYDWDNSDIGFPMTIDNVSRWKTYLETGEYNFNREN